ncbi:MAG: hypothetical protein HUU16_09390 [Candidatus Omnitrophica bacterium]|nr:hypothetical protein [Candidatus Omnitrophota bacterium]
MPSERKTYAANDPFESRVRSSKTKRRTLPGRFFFHFSHAADADWVGDRIGSQPSNAICLPP